MKEKDILYTIQLMKMYIETREKQINHLIEVSAFSTKFNHRIAKYYDDIADAKIMIEKMRNLKVQMLLNKK